MAAAFSGDCEKRGTGSSLFGSKKWQERTIKVVQGTLTYSKVGEPHPKKEPIKLAGYEVIERAAGGLVELTLSRQGAKTIFLRVQPEKRDAFVAAFEESGARRRERPQTAAGGGEAGTAAGAAAAAAAPAASADAEEDAWGRASEEELRADCSKAGISAAGTADELRARLRAKAGSTEPTPPSVAPPEPPQ
jgi:hypothetical protein